MSNVHTLIRKAENVTFQETIDKLMATLPDDEKNLKFQAGIMVVQTEDGLCYIPMSDTPVYTLVGMLEAIKTSLIDEIMQ